MKKPWETEPNSTTFLHQGYKCEVKRMSELGHLCGYVTLPDHHPDTGKHYDMIKVDVHGGLTFADGNKFGFDCAHYGDLVPALPILDVGEYRTMEWVIEETKRLADQFKAREKEVVK
jgi:hypothetical protein